MRDRYARPVQEESEADLLLSGAIRLDQLRVLRTEVGRLAQQRTGPDRAYDFTVAVNEVASNVIEHGGGDGWLHLWGCREELVCEVRDAGRGLADPAAGTAPPEASRTGGYGLWLARQLCSDVSVTSGADGTTVRLRMTID